ncbi:hypothetical protein QBC42DRAFT_195884 [Cladorrhinum samala]|uniref:Endo-1,3(4)-beta-glucanase 1 carbohydrate binding domain-containing protein n=1 Tax=Cladorrhinum samala TaxID=585594 RepID=A0AAV9HZN1_9PEZI|nr:hypothetical protein QBC42DRAFT_195884 [Cladorrhinum samala]
MKLLFACLTLSVAAQAQLLFCGSAPYYPSDYTCYQPGNILCPTLHGQPTLPCNGACYSPDMYSCSNGQLQLLPLANATSSPFKLQVYSSNPAINNRFANVCGLGFNVGAGAQTCVYCFNAPPLYDCSTYQNQTVLLLSGAMDVDVPGDQYWFIDPSTGRLRTTEAGKAGGYGRSLAGQSVTVYQDGYFSYIGSSSWLACLDASQSQVYNIYAPVGSAASRTDCERVKLAAVSTTNPKEGAYSYT